VPWAFPKHGKLNHFGNENQENRIVDYKAFYGTKEINVDGKTLFVYGENGSGKS